MSDPEKLDNSTDLLTVFPKFSLVMDFLDFIKDSEFPFLVLLLTEPAISEDMIQEKPFFSKTKETPALFLSSSSPRSSLPFQDSPLIPLIPSEEDL